MLNCFIYHLEGLNDGAAAVVLMSLDEARKRDLQPLARIVSHAAAGVPPEIMGTGPIPAVQKAVSISFFQNPTLDLFFEIETITYLPLLVYDNFSIEFSFLHFHR